MQDGRVTAQEKLERFLPYLPILSLEWHAVLVMLVQIARPVGLLLAPVRKQLFNAGLRPICVLESMSCMKTCLVHADRTTRTQLFGLFKPTMAVLRKAAKTLRRSATSEMMPSYKRKQQKGDCPHHRSSNLDIGRGLCVELRHLYGH